MVVDDDAVVGEELGRDGPHARRGRDGERGLHVEYDARAPRRAAGWPSAGSVLRRGRAGRASRAGRLGLRGRRVGGKRRCGWPAVRAAALSRGCGGGGSCGRGCRGAGGVAGAWRRWDRGASSRRRRARRAGDCVLRAGPVVVRRSRARRRRRSTDRPGTARTCPRRATRWRRSRRRCRRGGGSLLVDWSVVATVSGHSRVCVAVARYALPGHSQDYARCHRSGDVPVHRDRRPRGPQERTPTATATITPPASRTAGAPR